MDNNQPQTSSIIFRCNCRSLRTFTHVVCCWHLIVSLAVDIYYLLARVVRSWNLLVSFVTDTSTRSCCSFMIFCRVVYCWKLLVLFIAGICSCRSLLTLLVSFFTDICLCRSLVRSWHLIILVVCYWQLFVSFVAGSGRIVCRLLLIFDRVIHCWNLIVSFVAGIYLCRLLFVSFITIIFSHSSFLTFICVVCYWHLGIHSYSCRLLLAFVRVACRSLLTSTRRSLMIFISRVVCYRHLLVSFVVDDLTLRLSKP